MFEGSEHLKPSISLRVSYNTSMKLFDWQRSLDLLEQMRLRLVRSDSSSYIANLNAADPEIKLRNWSRSAIMAAGELVLYDFMCVKNVVDIDVIFCRY